MLNIFITVSNALFNVQKLKIIHLIASTLAIFGKKRYKSILTQ